MLLFILIFQLRGFLVIFLFLFQICSRLFLEFRYFNFKLFFFIMSILLDFFIRSAQSSNIFLEILIPIPTFLNSFYHIRLFAEYLSKIENDIIYDFNIDLKSINFFLDFILQITKICGRQIINI
jgi:hypothetical protein